MQDRILQHSQTGESMSTETILIVLLVVFLLGGGGWYFSRG
jgi:LPXTG-motif cell wall-anchored protein